MNYSTPGLPVYHQLPGVYSNSCPLSQWCHPTISSSVVPFSSRPQSFPASGSFQMSQLLTSGGQSIGVSASTSLLPMNTQDWWSLGWTDWISLQSKGLSGVFSNTTVQKHQFFGQGLLVINDWADFIVTSLSQQTSLHLCNILHGASGLHLISSLSHHLSPSLDHKTTQKGRVTEDAKCQTRL